MSTRNDGGPAFPIVHANETFALGMTLRDYFAAKAMQGVITGLTIGATLLALNYAEIGAAAYKIADAMLQERAK